MSTIPNSAIAVAPATSGGVNTATHEIDGKHYQVTLAADELGRIGQHPRYRFISGASAVGANKTHCHLWNSAGSGKVMRILSIFVYPKIDVAVTGVVAIEVFAARTSLEATGGSSVAYDVPSSPSSTISRLDLNDPVPLEIKGHYNPTGGMNNGPYLGSRWIFTEETNAGAAMVAAMGADIIRNEGANLIVREGQGIRVAQGSVAGVGSISIEINFELI